MTATIPQVLEVVRQRLVPAYPALGWAFGAKMLASNDWKGCHVVWTPSQTGDRFEPPDYVGQSPRCLRMLVASLVAHCRAPTFEACEQLRHDVASALLQELLGSVQVLDGGWFTQDGSLTYRGEVYLLRLELRLPVTDQLFGETATSVALEQVETSAALTTSSGDTPAALTTLP